MKSFSPHHRKLGFKSISVPICCGSPNAEKGLNSPDPNRFEEGYPSLFERFHGARRARWLLGSALDVVAENTRAPPGSVIRRRDLPRAIAPEPAVDPTCADRDRARSIALPLLGIVYGGIAESTSFARFEAVIAVSRKKHLVWIRSVVPADRLDVLAALL